MHSLGICITLFLLIFSSVHSKKLSRCELATELNKYLDLSDSDERLGIWICITNGKTETSLITSNVSNPNKRLYGIFQISNLYYCLDNASTTAPTFVNLCNVNCSDLVNEDLSDDIDCYSKIEKSQSSSETSTWNKWKRYCLSNDFDQYRYFDNCEATPQPTVPEILPSKETISFSDGERGKFIECQAESVPPPEVTWEYDDEGLSELKVQKLLDIPKGARLIFPTIHSYHDGSYTCIAKNFYSEARKVFYLKVKPQGKEDDDDNSNFPYGLVIGLPLTILVIGGLLILYLLRRLALKLKVFTKAEIREFLEGQPDKFENENGYINLHENVEHLPYDSQFDLNEDKLIRTDSKVLGTGQYGFVTKAVLDGKPVAVKSVKPNTDKLYIKTLLSELKIMIYLGSHPHVVSLIGAVTNKLNKGLVHVVVEFCENGDLEKYLKIRKNSFVSNIGKEQFQAEVAVSLDESHDVRYENTDTITTANLINWCEQIAKGMAYLSSKRVIHGDLAARNVLLDSNLNAKITDFGLSRQLYDYTNYVKKQQEPLPWRYMAIESLKSRSFSTESDVWSFGVTMWEIFSLGDVPYPGRSWSLDFVRELESGLRLLKPHFAPDFIYTKMMQCWNLNKDHRPTFENLSLLEDKCEQT